MTLLSLTSTRVQITWDVCYERSGQVGDYSVEFQEQGGATIPGEVIGKTFLAGALAPGRNYNFRVAEVNMTGHTGRFSDPLVISTEEESMMPSYS